MSISFHEGDCLDLLKTLPAASVQSCLTSPPYMGLRDYGTGSWQGGDSECDHSPEKRGSRFSTPHSKKQGSNVGSGTASRRNCSCGAIRVDKQIGMESTPSEYVDSLVNVFREVRRVLRDDGTLWLNLGDSYVSHKPRDNAVLSQSDDFGSYNAAFEAAQSAVDLRGKGYKTKDLLMIPSRVALALQDDGWWLRSAIIWNKPNPMPESVQDRPTSAYEYVFLLAKSNSYYYDQDAIRETPSGRTDPITSFGHPPDRHDSGRSYQLNGLKGANARNVWTITPKPYKGAHFATMPVDLATRCILAGSRFGDTILDPFAGAGTTGVAANSLGRNAILIELNASYIELARQRLNQFDSYSLNTDGDIITWPTQTFQRQQN